MGSFQSRDNEALKRSNVKLQAQTVSSFDGSAMKWHPWKKKTRAAIGTAGLLKVLDDETYATRNPVDNETIFHLLQVATSDGNAAHLVDKHEEECDGRKAYLELVKWYEGDDLTSETAEDIRSKIDKLSLSPSTSASNYINNFLQYIKLLEGLGESYTQSKTVSIFLNQISDPDYAATKENCIEDKLDLEHCIERIRSKERRVGRNKSTARKGIKIRRDHINTVHHGSEIPSNGEIDIERYKNQLGFYSIPRDIWNKLSNSDQSMIKKINGATRRKREREIPIEEKHGQSTSLTQRRNPVQETDRKRLKSVQFRHPETEPDDQHQIEDGDAPNEEGADSITTRRDIIRFKING